MPLSSFPLIPSSLIASAARFCCQIGIFRLMQKGLLALTVIALACSSALGQSKKEIIKETRTMRGTFLGFETGDYVHAVIRDSKGMRRSFFIGEPGLDFFLASNRNKNGSFTYQIVNCYIEEAGGREDIERLTKVTFGKLSSTTWWRSLKKKMSLDAINKKYEPLVNKADITGH